MAKCQICGEELVAIDQQKFYCKNCNKYFAVKQPKTPLQSQETSAPQLPQQQVEQQRSQVQPQPPSQQNNDELSALKARIATLEKEQQERTAHKTKMNKEAILTSPAWAWLKKYSKIILPALLGLIAVITIMVCFIGIRGVYVNVEDPSDFYSFTATQYKGYSEEFGEPYVENGTWKTSGGKIVLTVQDEDFGKFSTDYVYSTKNGYNTLFIGEDKDSLKEYKRVSIVKYDINAKKISVTFDLNGGTGNALSQKIKIGEKINEPDAPIRTDREFRGWYTEPCGYKNGGTRFDEDARIWESVTYYANWYNATDYTITLTGEASGTLTAKEGDSVLNILKTKYAEYDEYKFFYEDIIVNETMLMPAKNIEIKCVFNETHWQRLSKLFSFNGNVVSCKNTGLSGNIIIPSNYRGIAITGIGSFYSCVKITSITIPDSVTSIGDRAFSDCSGLTSISIGNNVTSIGELAFWGCTGLTSITIPDSVTSIGDRAFSDCSGLTSISIGNNVTSIGELAFWGCTGLTSITIPDGVTSIGDRAFENCSGLTSVTIGNSVTSIGDQAFYGCTSLTSINIPNSVTNIGFGAFAGCTSLTSIIIPNSVTSIGESAFSGCTGLTSISVDSGNTTYHVSGNCLIEKATKTIVVGNKNSVIPTDGSVTSIGNGAFYGCTSLTSITIPDCVTSIGNMAFFDCSNLTNITIPDSVTSIGDYAFYDTAWYNNQPDGVVYAGKVLYKYKGTMPDNTSIIIREGTTSIGSGAFWGCTGLTSITIPDSVTSIGDRAFWGCTSLTSITIPNSVTSIGKNAFEGCSKLTSITIPNSVTSIGDQVFYGCTSLTSIAIPDSVTNIGYEAFYGCTGLTSISVDSGNTTYHSNGNCLIETATKTIVAGCKNSVIPTDGSVTSIGKIAFGGCTGLTSITIPDSVTNIGNWAFSGCDSLTNITIPDSVTSIGDYAFHNCRGLTSVTIGNSVTSIGDMAFSGCRGLTDLVFNGTKAQWLSIEKDKNWNRNSGNFTIHCTDGDLDKNGNEI